MILDDKKKLYIKLALLGALCIFALLSHFIISEKVTSPEATSNTINKLDEKRGTVMELTAASTAASAAITLVPGDAGTPIANKLADLSTYFLVVLCAIYLEKYLLTITGYVAFSWLIPAACVLTGINIFVKNKTLTQLALKVGLFGFALFAVIPASVKVSDMIETTYRSSINETIENAKQTTDDIESESNQSEEDQGLVSGLLSKIKDGVSDVTVKFENILNRFIEALAVMIVTSCVIPILVLFFFIWLIKITLGININADKLPKVGKAI